MPLALVVVLHRTGFSGTCPPSGPVKHKTSRFCDSGLPPPYPRVLPSSFQMRRVAAALPPLRVCRHPPTPPPRARIPGRGAHWHPKQSVLSCFSGTSWPLSLASPWQGTQDKCIPGSTRKASAARVSPPPSPPAPGRVSPGSGLGLLLWPRPKKQVQGV